MTAPPDDPLIGSRDARLAHGQALGMPAGIEVFDRPTFLGAYWQYRPGEHVTILGPTGSGKTWWAYELLRVSAHPQLRGVVLVMKPRDETVEKWSKANRFAIVRSWPPMPNMWEWWGNRRVPGHVLWPKHTFDFDHDEAVLTTQMLAAIRDSYRKGNRILFADEVHGLTHELGLGKPLVTVWKRGRSMKCGLWGASQRPAHIPLDAYSQAEHLFIAHDPDKRARDRYAEIGGIDPEMIKDINMRLGEFQFCYIRRKGARVCVIDK
jgi:hypothetical protein